MTWDWTPGTVAALEHFLSERDIADGPLAIRRIGDGHSNLTYAVSDGRRQVIVRRPPPPPLPAGAHDMLREARLLDSLADSAVPVPRVLATSQAGEVIDVPFYVMSHVAGPVVTTTTPDTLSARADRRALGESLIDTLAALHDVDWRSAGLDDFGQPEGFNKRHLHRIATLVADADGNPPAEFADITEWLLLNAPAETGATIIHNDFRIGNVILTADDPTRIAAVLDWELATIGDPLCDLGYFLACYPEPGESLTPTGQLGTACLGVGFPTRAELAARYASSTNRDLTNLNWYIAMAHWKLAALYEYGRRRAVGGLGDPYYLDDSLVPAFLTASRRAAAVDRAVS